MEHFARTVWGHDSSCDPDHLRTFGCRGVRRCPGGRCRAADRSAQRPPVAADTSRTVRATGWPGTGFHGHFTVVATSTPRGSPGVRSVSVFPEEVGCVFPGISSSGDSTRTPRKQGSRPAGHPPRAATGRPSPHRRGSSRHPSGHDHLTGALPARTIQPSRPVTDLAAHRPPAAGCWQHPRCGTCPQPSGGHAPHTGQASTTLRHAGPHSRPPCSPLPAPPPTGTTPNWPSSPASKAPTSSPPSTSIHQKADGPLLGLEVPTLVDLDGPGGVGPVVSFVARWGVPWQFGQVADCGGHDFFWWFLVGWMRGGACAGVR